MRRGPAANPPAGHYSVDLSDLHGQHEFPGKSSGDESQLGAWSGRDFRPDIAHTARDWLAKLQLMASRYGLTTGPLARAMATWHHQPAQRPAIV